MLRYYDDSIHSLIPDPLVPGPWPLTGRVGIAPTSPTKLEMV